MKLVNKLLLASFIATILFSACSEKSKTTGWKYNDTKWGGFEKHKFKDQETGPGLVFIEGGTFVMGASEQDVTYDRNNMKRRMSVNSFYMDETEVTNLQYLEYVYWLNRAYGAENPIIATKALPDTLVWRAKLSYNEPYVNYYLRYPAYRDYPVVGVSWLQASEFCKWRSDRVNEFIMIREGLMKNSNLNKQNDETFNTEAYMLGLTPIDIKKQLKDYTPGGKKRDVKMEDGILLPIYRLPTEVEWEYASVAYRTASYNENVDSRKIYPWAGLTLRRGDTEKTRGRMYANYVRGRGDYKGIAGNLNDNSSYTSAVKDAFYIPNDFGLYHMAGNVSEWVMDVYRPLSLEDNSDLSSFRGNNYQTQERDADGNITEKDSMGRIKYRDVTEAENIKRRNYKRADNIGFRDELSYEGGNMDQKYEYGVTSLIDNAARVYKGGSWNDRAYWLSPGNRRYLDQEQSTSTIGFRCVMDRLGSQTKKGRK